MASVTRRFDLTTVGETMLRFHPPPGRRLAATPGLELEVGGAESNVCAALAQLGRRCGWLSRLPDNALGQHVLRRLRAVQIDTGAVRLAPGERLGTYFLDNGLTPDSPSVLYDRGGSAFARMTPEDLDWDYLLDTRVLHLTGITPALGPGCREIAVQALREAGKRGIPVSFDVNYRERLWPLQEARTVLEPFAAGAEILFCSHRDARRLFAGSEEPDRCLDELRNLSGARWLVLTLGRDGLLAFGDGRRHRLAAVPALLRSRPGAGDALAAGVIDGYLGGDVAEGLRRGTLLAALALAQEGDMVTVGRAELEALIAGRGAAILR